MGSPTVKRVKLMATIRDRYILEVDTQGGVRGLGNATGAVTSLGGALRGIGPLAVAAGGALAAIGAGQFISSVAEVTARTQDLKTALETVTGSADNADAAFQFINDFATTTPFNIEELTQTFIKLKSAGIEPTKELLTTFGDAASVSTDKVGSLQAMADLFSRTTSGGLGLEDLNRLADRGINVFGILEEQLGITRLEVSEFGKTAEGAQKIRDALVAGFNEDFGGGMARAADNISVAFSNLGIAADNALLAVGEGGLGAGLQYAAEAITQLLGQNSDLAEMFGSVLGEAVITATDAIVGLIENIQEGGPTLDLIREAVSNVAEIMGTLWEQGQRVYEALEPLTSVVFPALGEVLGFITDVIVTVVTGFADLVSGISEAVTSAENFRDAVTGAFTAVKDTVVNTVSSLVTSVIDLFQGLYDTLWGNSIIRDLIDGIIEGFTNLGPRVLEVVRAMIDGLISTFGELFTAIVDGIGGAIDRGLEKLSQAFTDFKNFFFGEEDEVVQAASETRAALEEALSAENLNAEAVGLTSEELERLAENLNNLVDPINQHKEDLEQSTELYEGLNEQLESITEKLGDYSDTVDELNELQQDQLDNQDELNELYEDFNEYLEQTNEFLTARIDLANSLNELTATEIENISSLNDLYEINLDRIESINSEYETTEDSLNSLNSLYPQINESIDNYNRGLGLLIERTADATVETQRLTQAMREVAEASAQAQRAAESARASIASAASAQKDFDFQQSTGGTAPQSTGNSVLDFFDGFFADGGTIGAGRFGVVGERGPEIVTGPATITPMDQLGGGAQYVNYNISAVDAQSFRNLVARDPEFIHAVAQKGSQRIPRRR